MSYPILSNAFKQAVVGEYSNTDTVIELASISDTVGNADFLPDPASGEYNVILYDTLFGNPADANNGGSYEIMRVTSINYGDNEITVTRGQENSTAVTITDRPFAVLYGATSKFFTDLLSDVDGKEDADPTILKEADVIDNLTSTDTDKPLSANQGKVLEDGKEPADATILKQADIVDNLTSTSTTAPLSANQGKVLNDTTVKLTGAQSVAGVKTLTDIVRATAGINFNASGGDTLDEYEEGTWTPVYKPSSGSDFASISYGGRLGRYVRIGKVVWINCHINTTALDKTGTISTAFIVVEGLPFVARSNNQSIALNRARGWVNNPSSALVFSDQIYFEHRTGADTPTILNNINTVSDTTASNQNLIQVAGFYEIN